jgi:hypothetical protein
MVLGSVEQLADETAARQAIATLRLQLNRGDAWLKTRSGVLIVAHQFDPFFTYPYPYAYPPDYMAANFGYVKIKTDRKDASVYFDGGFADKVEKAKKFAVRPGNHDIELRDSDGRTLYQERVAVFVGKTTELHAG